MNILFATTSLPHAQTTGGEIASQAFVEAIRETGHSVQIVGFARNKSSLPSGSFSAGPRTIETAAAGIEKYNWLARSFLSGRPYVCEKFSAKSYVDELRCLTSRRRADVLVIDHTQMGWLLPQSRKFAKHVIFVAHNQEAPLYAGEAVSSESFLQRLLLQRDSRLLGRLEPHLAQQADQIWTLSKDDRTAFATMTNPAKVSVMPLAGRSIPPSPKTISQRFDIGLLGTWAWEVNGRGLDWFVREVVPLLPRQVSIGVAGRGSERLGGLLPNLHALGFVEDPITFMHQSCVLAVPTRAGSGIQLKTIEAIASGARIVSTSLGVRGLDDLPEPLMVADTAQDFALALLQQLEQSSQLDSSGQDWAANRRTAFLQAVRQQLKRLEAGVSNAEDRLAGALA